MRESLKAPLRALAEGVALIPKVRFANFLPFSQYWEKGKAFLGQVVMMTQGKMTIRNQKAHTESLKAPLPALGEGARSRQRIGSIYKGGSAANVRGEGLF